MRVLVCGVGASGRLLRLVGDLDKYLGVIAAMCCIRDIQGVGFRALYLVWYLFGYYHIDLPIATC